jgi:hypothetical protein
VSLHTKRIAQKLAVPGYGTLQLFLSTPQLQQKLAECMIDHELFCSAV